MPPSESSRIFISYAHRDGAELAQRLQTDLANEGFDAWLDIHRLQGGDVWRLEIEQAIDRAHVVGDVQSGVLLATFTCDAPANCCSFIYDRKLIADDAGGHLHFLR